MKKDVADYISRYIEFQRVKDEDTHPMDFLQWFPILEKKWGEVTIDFINKIPRITRKHDSIMVVVDKLTKIDHFIPMKMDDTIANIAKIYMK